MKKDDRPQTFSDNAGYNQPNNIQGITASTWFGPLNPLDNFAPASVTGRAWDYPVGYNINYTPRPESDIGFEQLRRMVKSCDIMSIIINTRKDQVESREWVIRPTKESDLEDDDADIETMRQFWKKPDKVHTFDQWLRMWLDDLFVIDAPTLYIHRNRSGGIYGIENMDGSKIKLLIDAQGRRPQPPNPAYQAILKGVPARAYTTDELLYSARNLHTDSPYGRSPVEMAITTINAAINRAQFNRDYYREGNIPDAVGWLPESFTPQQAAEFTDWWDAMYAGNLDQRRKVKFVPGKGNFQQLREPELKNVYDDYIARVLCLDMGMSPQPFISDMNRATAQTAEETAEQTGQRPVENCIANTINEVIQAPQFFNRPDMEFAWLTQDDPDPAEQQVILAGYVAAGILSRDDARGKLGEEPEGGIAAELCITTSAGIMTLEDCEKQNEMAAKQSQLSMQQGQESHEQLMAGDGGNDVRKPSVDTTSPAAKSSGLKKNTVKTHIAPMTRPAIHAARAKAKPRIAKVLTMLKADVLHQVRASLGHIKKADDDIDLNLDLSLIAQLAPALEPILAEVAGQAGQLAVGSYNINDQGIVNQVNRRAVAFSQARSAELVKQITESTRSTLNAIITQGLEDNIGRQGIEDAIAGVTNEEGARIFSDTRAELIADYEVGNANGHGSLMGLQGAQRAGVKLKKEWYPDAEACPICLENADAGPIPIDEDFPSGDDAPLAHPNCECSLLGVTEG